MAPESVVTGPRELARMRDDAELTAMLTLLALPRVGPVRIAMLVARHGSARAALRAPPAELGAAGAAARGSRTVREKVVRALRALEDASIRVLWKDGPQYPSRIARRHDAPPILFVRGDPRLLERNAVAVVGSRAASVSGRDAARGIAAAIAGAAVPVVSGFARGIDAAAHRAALDAGGSTIAVLGAGIDVPYPFSHGRLRRQIAERGLLMTEFLPGEPPNAGHFPRRNRLIATQADAVVCVEAASKSGALNTARHVTGNTSVWIVRTSAPSKNTEGLDALLADGAKVLENVRQMFDEVQALRPFLPALEDYSARSRAAAAPVPAGAAGRRVLGVVGADPAHIDRIAAAAGLDPASALSTLLELEVDGRVRQLPGGRYVRVTEY